MVKIDSIVKLPIYNAVLQAYKLKLADLHIKRLLDILKRISILCTLFVWVKFCRKYTLSVICCSRRVVENKLKMWHKNLNLLQYVKKQHASSYYPFLYVLGAVSQATTCYSFKFLWNIDAWVKMTALQVRLKREYCKVCLGNTLWIQFLRLVTRSFIHHIRCKCKD